MARSPASLLPPISVRLRRLIGRRTFGLIIILGLALGCGVPIDEGPVAIQLTEETVPTTSVEDATPPGAAVNLPIYLVEAADEQEVLALVNRPAERQDARTALEVLFAAEPSEAESERGLFNAAASFGPEFRNVKLSDESTGKTIIVDFGEAIADTFGQDQISPLAQIVLTLAQDEPELGFETVFFSIEGEIVDIPDGEGLLVRSATRDSYARFDPQNPENRTTDN